MRLWSLKERLSSGAEAPCRLVGRMGVTSGPPRGGRQAGGEPLYRPEMWQVMSRPRLPPMWPVSSLWQLPCPESGGQIPTSLSPVPQGPRHKLGSFLPPAEILIQPGPPEGSLLLQHPSVQDKGHLLQGVSRWLPILLVWRPRILRCRNFRTSLLHGPSGASAPGMRVTPAPPCHSLCILTDGGDGWSLFVVLHGL